MDKIIFLGYELLAPIVPFLVVFMMSRMAYKRKGFTFSRKQFFAMLVLYIYIVGVYHLTGAGTIYDGLRYKLELRQDQINVIPFSLNIDIVVYFLNILLFVPMGLLAPIIWKSMNKLTNIIGIGFFFTLLIEISQLLNHRRTDIDDILLNVLGAVIGFGFFKLWDRFTNSKFQLNNSAAVELPIYIGIIFVGRFLLFNEMGLAKLLYNF